MAGDTSLARWLVGVSLDRGFTSARQAAKMLRDADGVEFSQAVFGTWLRGTGAPGPDNQQRLAEATGTPLGAVADLALRTREEIRAAARATARVEPVPPPVPLQVPPELAEAVFKAWLADRDGTRPAAEVHAGHDVAPTRSRLRPYEVTDSALEPRLWSGWLAWTEAGVEPRAGDAQAPGDIVKVRAQGRVYHGELVRDETGAEWVRTRDGRPPVRREDAVVLGVVTWVQHAP